MLGRGSRRNLLGDKIMKSALLCPPTYFEVRDVKNPFMTPANAPNAELAMRQWSNLCAALQAAGVAVQTIAAVVGLEDMVFSANQIFVGKSCAAGSVENFRFAVPSKMRFASRQLEVPYYTEWFRQHGYRIIELDLAGEYLEGHGDLLWHPDFSRVWAGYGSRSTRGAIERFSAAMMDLYIPVTPLELVHPSFYHLDTCFAPLNADAVLICPQAFSAVALRAIHSGWKRVHEVPEAEALGFCCNGIAVNGQFLISHCSQTIHDILRREGLQPVILDASEFEKSGGSLFCMKCFTDW